MDNMCPVCGYGMDDPPCEFNICPSCGTEFGNSDVNASVVQLRAAWLRAGARWWSEFDTPPDGWDPYEQVSALLDRPRHVSAAWFINEGLQRAIAGQDLKELGVQGSGGLYGSLGRPQNIEALPDRLAA